MLKGVKNPANSGSLQQIKLKHIFWIVLFSFFIWGYKNIQQVQTDIPLKSIWKPWAGSPSLAFSKKWGFTEIGLVM